MQAETGIEKGRGFPVSMHINKLASGACWTGDLQGTEMAAVIRVGCRATFSSTT